MPASHPCHFLELLLTAGAEIEAETWVPGGAAWVQTVEAQTRLALAVILGGGLSSLALSSSLCPQDG